MSFFLFDIYGAGERAIPGVSSEFLAQDLRHKSRQVTLVDEGSLEIKLHESVQDGDVILMQGAGSIGQMALNLMSHTRTE